MKSDKISGTKKGVKCEVIECETTARSPNCAYSSDWRPKSAYLSDKIQLGIKIRRFVFGQSMSNLLFPSLRVVSALRSN